MSLQYTPPSINRWNSHQQEPKQTKVFWIALFIALLLHFGLFLLFKTILIQQKVNTFDTIETETVYMDQVIIETDEVAPPEPSVTLPEEAAVKEMVPELEALAEFKNQDIEISPSITEPELSIKMSTPVAMGALEARSEELLEADLNVSTLDQIGMKPLDVPLVESGQVILEGSTINKDLPPASSLLGIDQLKGHDGKPMKGVMDGYNTMDELLSMSDISLAGAKAALPSDLLYKYDSAELKASAKYGLMKLALLINRNPEMYCILEGHSDLFGAEDYNLDLSRARAQAVKDYLVGTLRQKGERIIVKAYGKSQPLLKEGSIEEQSINRRVDILMRKTLEAPPAQPIVAKPEKEKPILVKPQAPDQSE